MSSAPQPTSLLRSSMTRLVGAFGGAAILVGLLALVGWWLELDVLRQVLPTGTAMNPASAVLFVLLGSALALFAVDSPAARRVANALAVVVLVASGLELGEQLFPYESGLDQTLFAERLHSVAAPVPSYMGRNTAICFFLLAAAYLLGRRADKGRVLISQGLALTAAWIALVALIGYAHRISHHSPYGAYLPMALNSGFTLVGLSVGVLFMQPGQALTSVLFRQDPGGKLARRLIPPFVLLPVGLGVARLRGEQLGWFDPTVGAALLIACLVATSVALIWALAFSMSRTAQAREQVQIQLKQNEALLMEAQTIAHMGSWEQGPSAGAMTWSDEMFRLLGWPPRAVVPSRSALLEQVHPEDRDELRGRLERGEPFTAQVRIIRPDGQCRILALRYEVVPDPLRPAGRAIGVAQDVTEQRAIERMKDEFVSVVSHELRTPLTAIRGSLGLLASGRLGQLDSRGQDMLEVAARNSDRLVRLINDILDVERMASGSLVLQPRTCRTDELLHAAVEAMATVAQRANVTLELEPGSWELTADADRLHQVLTNLIDNAVKFSSGGSRVRLAARKLGSEVRFQVSDDGRGIPPDRLEAIFERFGQVDASDSRQKGGTGLGLTICRNIVQLHGGRIWAESVLGEGSTFYVVLPVDGDGSAPRA